MIIMVRHILSLFITNCSSWYVESNGLVVCDAQIKRFTFSQLQRALWYMKGEKNAFLLRQFNYTLIVLNTPNPLLPVAMTAPGI